MAIKRGSKVDKSFSSSAMTDLMFLLLIFMLIATTLINPNALKLMLPQSSNQLKDKAITTVSIQHKGSSYEYYVELDKVVGIAGVEQALRENVHLRKGLTAYDGKLTLAETALKQGRTLYNADEMFG